MNTCSKCWKPCKGLHPFWGCCDFSSRNPEIDIKKAVYHPERGWYIRWQPRGKIKRVTFLHKDGLWHNATGWIKEHAYPGSAPGYYQSKAFAQVQLNEWYEKNDERKTMIKKGDKVKIQDLSYSRTVRDNELKRPKEGLRGEFAIVVETGCKFPNTGSFFGEFNNTIIQVIDTGGVIFICDNQLGPATRTIEFDGKKIELSEKSYNNFKKQFLND